MGFWSKLGKIALTAAPYVAAPFTGGASLAFAPMAKQAVGAWSQHDANKAAAKGLAPSSFDRYLGMASDMAGMAGGAGAFGSISPSMSAAKFNAPLSATGKMGTLARVGQGVMDRFGGVGQGGYGGPQYGGPQPQYSQMSEPQMGSRGLGPRQMDPSMFNPMGMSDQNNPNLSQFIGQGRREAINDQPFRGGYEVNYLGSDDETPFKSRMPKIGAVQPERKGRASKTEREAVN